jgi:hypothetical protein
MARSGGSAMTSASQRSGVTILGWKLVRRGTLCGFSIVRIERIGLVIADVAIHQKNQSRWVSLPSKPMLDATGAVLRDETTGKVRYQSLLQWYDRKTADRFSRAVIEALQSDHPGAFDGDAP